MKTTAYSWRWVALGLLALGCVWIGSGCSDEENDADDAAAVDTVPVVIVVTNNGVATTVVTNIVPAASEDEEEESPAATEQVLLDVSQTLNGPGAFRVFTAPAPAQGWVKFILNWSAINLISNNVSWDFPLELRANLEVEGAGAFYTAEAWSPYSQSVDTESGVRNCIVVSNKYSHTRLSLHVRAVWTPE